MRIQSKNPNRPGRPPRLGQFTSPMAANVASEKADPFIVFLSLKDVCRCTTLSKGQIQRLVAMSAFPHPVSLSVKRRAWVHAEVQAWMVEKMTERQED